MKFSGALRGLSVLSLLVTVAAVASIASAAACNSSGATPSLCNTATGVCADGSTVEGLASGYTVPPQYGTTCTSGTYFIGPEAAWRGTCGANVYVVCIAGSWSGAFCGDYLGTGWFALGADGGLVVDAAEEASTDAPDAAVDARGDTNTAFDGTASDAASKADSARDADAAHDTDAAHDADAAHDTDAARDAVADAAHDATLE